MKTKTKTKPRTATNKHIQALTQRAASSSAASASSLVQRHDLRHALQVRILQLAVQPLTPRSLTELEQTAKTALQMLTIGADPHAFRGQRRHSNQGWQGDSFVGMGMNVTSEQYDGGDSGDSVMFPGNPELSQNPFPLSSSSYQENFGATALRELVALRAKNDEAERAKKAAAPSPAEPTPPGILDLIADARKKGLTDVAARLEEKLFASVPDAPAKATPGKTLTLKKSTLTKMRSTTNGVSNGVSNVSNGVSRLNGASS
jgi:hypothetical protein